MQYPCSYNIVQRKGAYVANVLESVPLNLQFGRSLQGDRWIVWIGLVRRLMEGNLSDEADRLHWKLSKNGIFSIKTMYLDLIDSGSIPRSIHIWRIKVPLRIKNLTWFVHKEVILTKDNLAKRNWLGNKSCGFCS